MSIKDYRLKNSLINVHYSCFWGFVVIDGVLGTGLAFLDFSSPLATYTLHVTA
jgi:hypothetical protein